MEQAGIEWVAAIIIGGLAGWLAETVTRSNIGLLTDVILGMIGAGVAAYFLGCLVSGCSQDGLAS